MTDYQNAKELESLLKLALEHLIDARRTLDDTVERAEQDYAHHADNLIAIRGALQLATSATAVELSKWIGYTVARSEKK